MQKDIIEDLLQGTTISSLSNKYGYSYSKIENILKELQNNGIQIDRNIISDGTIIYSICKELKQNSIRINCENNIRIIIISDLHIGAGKSKDGLIYMKDIYSYAKKNNIHFIFCLGDLFNGIPNESFRLVESQLKSFFNDYPYDSSITNIMLFGNHDYTFMKNMGIDVSQTLHRRPDVISLGYGIGNVYFNDEIIGFKHDLVYTKPINSLNSCKILFKGHSHRFEIVNNSCVIVPALLNEDFNPQILSTGFLDVNFDINKTGKIDQIKLRHLVFLPEITPVNDIYIPKVMVK